MAIVFGNPGPEVGDIKVYEGLKALPDECIVYAQQPLIHKRRRSDPDYIIVHRERGVIILEVKDWVNIVSSDRTHAQIRRRSSDAIKTEKSPVEQARKACLLLVDMLKEDEDLCKYSGKLKFPFNYAAILPHQPPNIITRLEKSWGETRVLGRDDILPQNITQKINNIALPFRYSDELTSKQMRAVRAIIDGDNKVIDHKTGKFKGVYNSSQEAISKEPLRVNPDNDGAPSNQQSDLFADILLSDYEKRMQHLEREMPLEAAKLKSNTGVRLVRGFAGTGKTDVLILRANYLHKQYPDINILVTTFNKPIVETRLQPELRKLDRVDVINFDKLCSAIHKIRTGHVISAQNTHGVLKRLSENNADINHWGVDFLSEEIIWMKEIGRTNRKDYCTLSREGRGGASGKTLTRKMKEEIFDIFNAYQHELREIFAQDWVDRHSQTLNFLESGTKPTKMYDVILVDEAQHFAPNWIPILYHFLKPQGSVFICDDPSQSVYRFFSWKQKGVDVVGRTRWLRVPYRNTKQIFKAAFSLIAVDDLAQLLLGEENIRQIEVMDDEALREGPKPKVCHFDSVKSERTFIQTRVEALLDEGWLPDEIGVLHTKNHVIKDYKNRLPHGIHVFEARRQTGLEYSVVFIPQIQNLFDRKTGISWEEDQSRQRMTAYMMMTRTRSDLYLSYQGKYPKIFNPMRELVSWCDESSL